MLLERQQSHVIATNTLRVKEREHMVSDSIYLQATDLISFNRESQNTRRAHAKLIILRYRQ